MTALLALALAASGCGARPWPFWQRYAERFITAEGRVVDLTDGQRSTSEGQAYGLFHALVADDRAAFDRILGWTDRNLAEGLLGRKLPAWLWGRGGDGAFRVLDRNSASDADLWMAYALLEAGRLWDNTQYVARGAQLLRLAAASEVAALPGLGLALLPGPRGFELVKDTAWRLNPSYSPPQLFRRFASLGLPGPWEELLASSVRLIKETATHGFSPDWAVWKNGGFAPDPVNGPKGSYDAIRVYLWAAMLPADEPLREELLPRLRGPLDWLGRHGSVPEAVDTAAPGERAPEGPPGFAAALLPLASVAGDEGAAGRLHGRVASARVSGLLGNPPAYYEQNLALFAFGFLEGRFRFGPDGALLPDWAEPCGQ